MFPSLNKDSKIASKLKRFKIGKQCKLPKPLIANFVSIFIYYNFDKVMKTSNYIKSMFLKHVESVWIVILIN